MYIPFEPFLMSTGIVALAEIGDKTQLLAFMLAARFRRPCPIILGIFIATIANHAFAAAVGTWITSLLGPDTLRWVLGLSFLAMAAWTLVPDKLDEGEISTPAMGVLGATIVAFFLAEMGDKRPRWVTRPRSPRWRWPHSMAHFSPSSQARPSA